MSESRAREFVNAVDIAVLDHRNRCKHCKWSHEYEQWNFCTLIQPLVDFLSLLN